MDVSFGGACQANGTPGEVIQHRRGLRQGDPLSLMLFIFVMDILNWMVAKASQEGLLQPFLRRPTQHRISLYADDVALFLQPTAADINLMLQILSLWRSLWTQDQCLVLVQIEKCIRAHM